jgi:hypothetical protein
MFCDHVVFLQVKILFALTAITNFEHAPCVKASEGSIDLGP